MPDPTRHRRAVRGDDPIAHLLREHNDVLARLKQLKSAARGVLQEGYVARYRSQFRSSLTFLEEEILVHNRKEERALFPVLERLVEGPTVTLRNEHRMLRKGLRKLQRAVRALERTPDSFRAIHTLARTTGELVQLCVNHIHTENNILFPLVRRVLPKEDLRRVAERLLADSH